MERREFIRKGCGLCAGLAAIGSIGLLTEGCTPGKFVFQAASADGKITVPAEKFLNNKYLIVREPKLQYDLLLVKVNETSFHTLVMQCTHREQPLVVTSTGIICNEHGSRFDFSGNVLRDPATQPLRKYKTELADNNIVIHLARM